MKAYYLFGKQMPTPLLDEELKFTVQYLKKLESKERVLHEAYRIVVHRFEGGRLATYGKIFDLFSSGLGDLWNRSGFMHCTNQNYLLASLLLGSGKFDKSDIWARWTLIWGFSPHQYLRVELDDKFVNVDCWSAKYGIKLGDYAHFRHAGSLRGKKMSNLNV